MGVIEKLVNAVEAIHRDKEWGIKLGVLCALSLFSVAIGIMMTNVTNVDLLSTMKTGQSPSDLEMFNAAFGHYGAIFVIIYLICIVCMLIKMGYSARYINSLRKDPKSLLPDFDNMFDFFVQGLKFIPGALAFGFISFIALAIALLILSGITKVLAIQAWFFVILVAILVLVYYYMLLAVFISYAYDLKMGSPLNFRRIFLTAFSKKYACVLFIMGLIIIPLVIIYAIIGLLSAIIHPIIMILAIPAQEYLLLVNSNLMAQAMPEYDDPYDYDLNDY